MVAYFNSPIGQLLGWRGQMAQGLGNYAAVTPMSAGDQAQRQWAGSQVGTPYTSWLPPTLSSRLSDQPNQWLESYLPFQAAPGGYGAVAPMGAGGQALGQWAGHQAGNWLGIPGLGSVGRSLGDLLPFQAGSGEFGGGALGGMVGGWAGGSMVPMGAGSTDAPPVDPGTQAVNDLTRVATSSAIQRLYEYLSANSPTTNQLEEVIPIVKEAADAFGQGNYSQAFIAVYQAFLSITMLRAQVPALPAL